VGRHSHVRDRLSAIAAQTSGGEIALGAQQSCGSTRLVAVGAKRLGEHHAQQCALAGQAFW
jgi:hypothetical protein